MARKKRLSQKYIARRLLLVVVVFLLAAFSAVYMGYKVIGMLKPPEASPEVEPPPVDDPVEPVPSSEAPEPVSSTVEPDPEPVTAPVPAVDLTAWNLILVNDRQPLPEAFDVSLEYVVPDFAVDARIVEPLQRMFAQGKEDGISLIICSAHRSVEHQQNLYSGSIQKYLAAGKTQEEAERLTGDYYAYPGTSEHHTGLAVDIVTKDYQSLNEGYAATPAARWLAENAWKYGFILRYPKDKVEITKIQFEPWHYRYVGEEAAAEIYATGLSLEEYIYLKELEQGHHQTESSAAPDDSAESDDDAEAEASAASSSVS